ncbi:hypothetical protein FQR65_LT01330 [Abscondita terminalis]|nr:hypothetical protein FQR65_LT01330 [Abscondita terminalis]
MPYKEKFERMRDVAFSLHPELRFYLSNKSCTLMILSISSFRMRLLVYFIGLKLHILCFVNESFFFKTFERFLVTTKSSKCDQNQLKKQLNTRDQKHEEVQKRNCENENEESTHTKEEIKGIKDNSFGPCPKERFSISDFSCTLIFSSSSKRQKEEELKQIKNWSYWQTVCKNEDEDTMPYKEKFERMRDVAFSLHPELRNRLRIGHIGRLSAKTKMKTRCYIKEKSKESNKSCTLMILSISSFRMRLLVYFIVLKLYILCFVNESFFFKTFECFLATTKSSKCDQNQLKKQLNTRDQKHEEVQKRICENENEESTHTKEEIKGIKDNSFGPCPKERFSISDFSCTLIFSCSSKRQKDEELVILGDYLQTKEDVETTCSKEKIKTPNEISFSLHPQ